MYWDSIDLVCADYDHNKIYAYTKCLMFIYSFKLHVSEDSNILVLLSHSRQYLRE